MDALSQELSNKLFLSGALSGMGKIGEQRQKMTQSCEERNRISVWTDQDCFWKSHLNIVK